jgi:hypothetical protein
MSIRRFLSLVPNHERPPPVLTRFESCAVGINNVASKLVQEEWIEETLRIQNSLKGRRRSIGFRIHQENLISYRILQYKLKRKVPPPVDASNDPNKLSSTGYSLKSKEEFDCLYTAIAEQLVDIKDPTIVKAKSEEIRKGAVEWLRSHKEYTMVSKPFI